MIAILIHGRLRQEDNSEFRLALEWVLGQLRLYCMSLSQKPKGKGSLTKKEENPLRSPRRGWGCSFRQQSSCLCIKSLAQSLATHTAVTSALRKWRQEDEKFKSIRSYRVSSRQPELHETQYIIKKVVLEGMRWWFSKSRTGINQWANKKNRPTFTQS